MGEGAGAGSAEEAVADALSDLVEVEAGEFGPDVEVVLAEVRGGERLDGEPFAVGEPGEGVDVDVAP